MVKSRTLANSKAISHGQLLVLVAMDLRGDVVYMELTDAGGFVFEVVVSVDYARQFSIGDDVLVEFLPRPKR